MPTLISDLVANALLKVVFLTVALAFVSILYWLIGPGLPPPPVPSAANLVLFWQLGSAAPPMASSFRFGCRRYTKGITDAHRSIADSPIFRARRPSVRLIMPGVCQHPRLSCGTNRWPALLQQQLFSSRADFRVDVKSRPLNCSSEAERAKLQRDESTNPINLIQAHCTREPEDLVAFLNTASPRRRDRTGLPELLGPPERTEMFEGLLGKVGETECLQRCFIDRPATGACSPRRRSATYWWARCSAVNRVGLGGLSAILTAGVPPRHARNDTWQALRAVPTQHGELICWAMPPRPKEAL